MSDVLIHTQDVKVVYNPGKDNEFLALDSISVDIYKEEYTIFFGPSGCGKSTLLYTILGLQHPSGGKVFIGERDTSTLTKAEKNATLTDFFGIVFQNFNLIYSLNVIDNVALPQMFVKQGERKERYKKALELLKRFGIDSKAHVLPGTLSGGQQQRVAICRALINDPEVILADEPVGNLDSQSAEVVMETLKEINEHDKKTVILVTHDPSYLRFADRVYFFKYGHIDRMVVNPKAGKQLQRHYSTESETTGELEKLAHVHPNLSADELKAWSVTNYLLEECAAGQIQRLEQAMELMLSGKASEQEFYEHLHTPYSDGGVGLYRPTALRYTMRVRELLRLVSEYKATRSEKFSETKRQQVAEHLAQFIVEDYRGNLSGEQQTRLKELVAERIVDRMSLVDFVTTLEKPVSEKGIGLHATTAERLSDRLELVLAQSSK